MIKFYRKSSDNVLVEIDKLEKGCWINICPPFNQTDLQGLADQLDIPIDFFIDSLDIDERSRYEQDEGVQLIVVNIPIKNPKEDKYTPPYITIPIGMIEVDDYIITLSAYENPVINHLLSRLPKSFSTTDHSQLVLIVFEKTVDYFIHYLRMINNQRGEYEKELYNSTRNQELSSMMNLQKSLVYFLTNLRDNSMMMFKIQRTDFLRIQNNEEQQDLFEDILIDMEQAQDMAATYSDILRNTMEALSSMISNNLNTIMKRLTSITIVLMVPTLVASFYGMNVPILGQEYIGTFPVVVLLSIFLSAILVWIFRRNRLL